MGVTIGNGLLRSCSIVARAVFDSHIPSLASFDSQAGDGEIYANKFLIVANELNVLDLDGNVSDWTRLDMKLTDEWQIS